MENNIKTQPRPFKESLRFDEKRNIFLESYFKVNQRAIEERKKAVVRNYGK